MSFWTPKARLRWAFVVLRDHRLRSTDKVVAVFCEGYVNSDGQFWVSKRTISRQLHISEKTAQRSLKSIADFRYMRVRRRVGTTPVYTIQFPEPENDQGAGQVEPAIQDTIVPLTLYKPETKPFPRHLTLSVGTAPGSELSNRMEEFGTVTDIADFAKRKKLGKFEVALAERLGPNGYDILASLPWPKLMYLLLKTSNGSVSESDLTEARANWLKKMTDTGGV